jgi:hypothetical protein
MEQVGILKILYLKFINEPYCVGNSVGNLQSIFLLICYKIDFKIEKYIMSNLVTEGVWASDKNGKK